MANPINQITSIPIASILSKLGINFTTFGNTLHLKEGDKQTDGRKGNVQGNYINDFTGRRARGSPFGFIKSLLKLSNKETFERFEQHYNIRGDPNHLKKYKHKKSISPLRNTLSESLFNS